MRCIVRCSGPKMALRTSLRTCLLLTTLGGCGDATALAGADGGAGSGDSSGAASVDSGVPTPVCTPGARSCSGEDVQVCDGFGTGWVIVPCEPGATCQDGVCLGGPAVTLLITTQVLAPAQVGTAYEATLAADGGDGAYAWSLAGDAPPGLALADDGTLAGTPTLAGDYLLDVAVQDGADAIATRTLSLSVHPEPLTILTPPQLGAIDEGLPFEKPLLAKGGNEPYGWFIVGGHAPQGVFLDAAGVLTGVPTEPGAFDFRVRVVDVSNPPGWDELDFSLQVDLRPLNIVGSNIIDLLAFKVVVLPLLAIVPGIPVPYSTQLEADGGLSPYHWTEQPVPNALQVLVPTAGVPDGLTLHDDGTLDGAVDNTDQVITVGIPLSAISLTGFFFFAEVADSQDPAEIDQALFLVPTVPVGG